MMNPKTKDLVLTDENILVFKRTANSSAKNRQHYLALFENNFKLYTERSFFFLQNNLLFSVNSDFCKLAFIIDVFMWVKNDTI
nr:hypothetical protein GTC16762_14270 [Pigmentibacter ruber]